MTNNLKVEDMIFESRGCQVMLDSDLAKLYQVETKRINEAVARNIEKFPKRFSWILSDEEERNLRSQIATSSLKEYGGRRYNSRVFTEQGVAMLATILKSKVATNVSIQIMDAFVAMRKYISSNLIEQKYINNLVLEHDSSIKQLQETFSKLEAKEKNHHIFFEGQIYDAYSLLITILNTAKENIVIIDNYVDKNLLDILSQINKRIEIITSSINQNDIEKYKEQYHNLEIIKNKSFHDRFIILDKRILYHCGASFKDLGKKCFAINKIEDTEIIETLLNNFIKS